jgi:hypothetical protein
VDKDVRERETQTANLECVGPQSILADISVKPTVSNVQAESTLQRIKSTSTA